MRARWLLETSVLALISNSLLIMTMDEETVSNTNHYADNRNRGCIIDLLGMPFPSLIRKRAMFAIFSAYFFFYISVEHRLRVMLSPIPYYDGIN